MAKYSIKQILLSNQNWWRFYNKHKDNIRSGIVIAITKLLSCKNTIRGYHQYHCANPNCNHVKRIPHTCKSKACSSCGKKATELWINKQLNILPKTSWQHITFTMPAQLWDFFWCNRELLNDIGSIAAYCIKSIAKKKKVVPGIFIAIHTFGRNLKRNVHIHLSTTAGGLSFDGKKWEKLFFKQSSLMKMWRYQIISLFRSKWNELVIPNHIKQLFNHTYNFQNFLDDLYNKNWIVHCDKTSDNFEFIVNYLGRYVKRPPIAEAKLKHYDGFNVVFKFLDHKSKTFRNCSLSVEQFIAKFIQHIPDVGFRMIRYYGFLANRVRGKLLNIVYQLLNQNQQIPIPKSHADLIQKNFGFNPLTCILCGSPMLLENIVFGKCNSSNLLQFHQDLALLKIH